MNNNNNPNQFDVLLGRGKRLLKHPGNIAYRDLVLHNKVVYTTSTKTDKLKISKSIVNAIHKNGRFLKQDNKTKQWLEIGQEQAIRKTSQALREQQEKIRDALAGLVKINQRLPSQQQQEKIHAEDDDDVDNNTTSDYASIYGTTNEATDDEIDDDEKAIHNTNQVLIGGAPPSAASSFTTSDGCEMMTRKRPASSLSLLQRSTAMMDNQDAKKQRRAGESLSAAARTTTPHVMGGGIDTVPTRMNSLIDHQASKSRASSLSVDQLRNELYSLKQYIIEKENSWKETKHHMEQQYYDLEDECEHHVKHFTKLKNVIANKNDIIKQQQIAINILFKRQERQQQQQSSQSQQPPQCHQSSVSNLVVDDENDDDDDESSTII